MNFSWKSFMIFHLFEQKFTLHYLLTIEMFPKPVRFNLIYRKQFEQCVGQGPYEVALEFLMLRISVGPSKWTYLLNLSLSYFFWKLQAMQWHVFRCWDYVTNSGNKTWPHSLGSLHKLHLHLGEGRWSEKCQITT